MQQLVQHPIVVAAPLRVILEIDAGQHGLGQPAHRLSIARHRAFRATILGVPAVIVLLVAILVARDARVHERDVGCIARRERRQRLVSGDEQTAVGHAQQLSRAVHGPVRPRWTGVERLRAILDPSDVRAASRQCLQIRAHGAAEIIHRNDMVAILDRRAHRVQERMQFVVERVIAGRDARGHGLRDLLAYVRGQPHRARPQQVPQCVQATARIVQTPYARRTLRPVRQHARAARRRGGHAQRQEAADRPDHESAAGRSSTAIIREPRRG